MPVAFFQGGCERPWQQQAHRALAQRGGLWGLAQGRQPRLQLQAARTAALVLGLILLQLLIRKVVLPVFTHPDMPLTAILGQGACSGGPSAGLPSYGAAELGGLAAGSSRTVQPGDVASSGSVAEQQGGLLWRGVLWCCGLIWYSIARPWTILTSQAVARVCRDMAVLCDDSTMAWMAADCAGLFGR